MNRPRVVLDTNVIVSAAVKPGGLEERIVELVAAREIALCLSAAVLAEYEMVLARQKFQPHRPRAHPPVDYST